MRQTLSLKIVYISALFALGFLGIMVRLWVMQVDSDSPFRDGAKAVRTRKVAFFPSRARILDRDGKVLADNRSQWEVHADLWALLSPANALARTQVLSSDASLLAKAQSFQRDQVMPLLSQEYPSPSVPNLFFALWDLRKDAFVRADRERLLITLSEQLEIPLESLEARVSLVEEEVDALRTLAKDGTISISSAYMDSKRALRDGEYWQEIIRFPKSIALESQLTKRVVLSEEMLKYLEIMRETLEEDPENAEAYLKKAADNARLEEANFKNITPAPNPFTELEVFTPFSAWPTSDEVAKLERRENARFWHSLRQLFSSLDATNGTGVLDAAITYLQASDEEAYSLRDTLDRKHLQVLRDYRGIGVRDRLAQLQSRIYQGDPSEGDYSHAYRDRWISFLRYDADTEARLESNPLRLAKKVTREAVEHLKLYSDGLEGLSFVARAERVIVDPSLMPNLLGTLAKPTPETIDDAMARFSAYDSLSELLAKEFYGDHRAFESAFRGTVAENPAGINGVEGFHEQRLAGEPGARVSFVDARGHVRSVEGEWSSRPNGDFALTIDSDTQRFAAETFKKYEKILGERAAKRTKFWDPIGMDKWSLRGGFAMIDVETGGIIAMVSFPSFDPELLAAPTLAGEQYRDEILRGGSEADWPKSLHFLKKSPMYDRTVAAKHAPGSVMKPLMAIAALEEGVIGPSFTYLDNQKIHKATGANVGEHREYKEVDVPMALAASLNGFFYELTAQAEGRNAGDRYRRVFLPWLEKFGFGSAPGLDIRGPQSSGTLPEASGLNPTALANASIGQGDMEASLLQVLRFYSAIATRGYLPTPHLSAEGDYPRQYVNVSDQTWDLIHKGLRGALESAGTGDALKVNGTARFVKSLKRINAAGKTGTAEIGSWFDSSGNDHPKPDHSWFAGFAPQVQPKVAFVGLAEYSGLYGADVGDLCGEIAEFWLNKQAQKAIGAASVKAQG